MKKIFFVIVFLMACVNMLQGQLWVVNNGDTTEIWDSIVDWSCGAQFLPVTRTSQDTIYITELDTMWYATCLCNYSFCTKLTDLNAGTYTASVTRQKNVHYYDPVDTIYEYSEFAGTVNFTITKAPARPPQVAFYQSPCSGSHVNDGNSIPNNFLLLTNYPNPFNPGTIIRYSVPRKSHVTLIIYNLTGQQIAILVDGEKPAGSYDISYNASRLSSGMYVCRLMVGGSMISSRMVLIK